jgi:ribose-phosphate pyrophosphokinase
VGGRRQACLVFAPSESRALALAVAREAELDVAPLEERSFEEGEFKLRPLVSVRGRDVFIVQSLAGSTGAPVAGRLLRLLFLSLGLRDAGASAVVAVVPYLSFARKDRRTQPRDPVYTRYVAQLLEAAGIDRLVTLDAHNAAALDNAFRIPVDHLSAMPLFAAELGGGSDLLELAVASPDVGGIKRAQLFRELLERRSGRTVDLVFIEKRRVGGVVSGGQVVGDVAGRMVIVLDDLCATGGTLIRAATALRAAGAAAVRVAVTHAPLASGLAALVAADSIDGILVTDSVSAPLAPGNSRAERLEVLPIAPLLGQAMIRMSSGIPVAPLLESWPPHG